MIPSLKDEETRLPQLGSLPPGEMTTVEVEILDWDAYIVTPPPRPQGTIQVQMTYGGRSRPIPAADPNEE